MTEDLLYSLSWIQPELILAGAALALAVLGAFLGDKSARFIAFLATAAIVAAGVLAAQFQPNAAQHVFDGVLVIDKFGAFAKVLTAAAAAVTLLLGADFFSRGPDRRFEFAVLTLLSTTGFFVMVSSNNLMTLYIGIELQSLAAYVLAAFSRDNARSSEAGLKYFVLGALSSGILLYGASLIYGFSGSTSFDGIAAGMEKGNVGLVFGLVFLICGIAFKMSAAPFHMWTPDVYEGAPTPVTAFFAAAPKVAAVVLMARVLTGPFEAMTPGWQQVLVALSALSLIVGSFAALVQTSVKRLMAYSSIANMGFVLMGLAGGGQEGASSALIFLTYYLPATIASFAIILAMRRNGVMVEKISDLAGLGASRPWMAVVLTIAFFSFAGVPPLVGFWGKFYVFKAALDAGLWPLCILGALATVVAAGYYLWVMKVVWFDTPGPAFDRTSATITGAAVLGAALTFPILVIGLGSVEAWANAAATIGR